MQQEENLRRRTLKPSEAARAIGRLHQLYEVKAGGNTSIVG